ncbi:hypothetical protein C1Y35_09805 [Pseudomonas sp. GW456-L14]|uniref:hypothetical protein n=1 Tax=unclassified Pseudomonas TaxID=196821 RepID=UPI000C884703|nr:MULTISPECIES: hypothetical protein [unclassified Pseudomonas]PMY40855.1 hypothetical protein C1Y35_09805 [Pseudomonas sp. GW456-L14]PMY58001.1 hypothetical protein C1Y34_05710 [Pseudomonas sp. GW456-L12]
MKNLIVIFAVLVLVGCTTNAKVHVVRGVSGIEIDCSGLGAGWDKCHKRAERECKGDGYKVITRSSDAKDEEGDYPFGWNPAGYLTRTMLVMCR